MARYGFALCFLICIFFIAPLKGLLFSSSSYFPPYFIKPRAFWLESPDGVDHLAESCLSLFCFAARLFRHLWRRKYFMNLSTDAEPRPPHAYSAVVGFHKAHLWSPNIGMGSCSRFKRILKTAAGSSSTDSCRLKEGLCDEGAWLPNLHVMGKKKAG